MTDLFEAKPNETSQPIAGAMDAKDWRAIVRQIRRRKCTPLISNRLISSHLLSGENSNVVELWAKEIDFPLDGSRHRLSRVGQFWSITRGDRTQAKDEYLDFLRQRMLQNARSKGGNQQSSFLDLLEEEIEKGDLSTCQIAKRLNLFNFDRDSRNPLRVLANLPIPIYLTTSYHDLIEDALTAAGKRPKSEICYWQEDLRDSIPSVFDLNRDYRPTEEEPLVYHLCGREAYPASMVLTEDDYLDFLVRVSREQEAILAPRVNQALADSLLLMLGYQVLGWDFRVLLRGLIRLKPSGRRPKSFAIQLPPTPGEHVEGVRAYLEEYFKKNKFEIFWGPIEHFANDLWQHWS